MIAAYRALLRISWCRFGAPLAAAIALLNLTANQGWVGGAASTAVAVTNAFGLALPLMLATAGLDGARDRATDSCFAPQRAARNPFAVNALQAAASATWISLAYAAVTLAAVIATARENPGTLPSVFALTIGYLATLALLIVAMAIGRHTPVLVGLLVNIVLTYLALSYLAGEPESVPALFTVIDDTFGPPGVVFDTATGLRQGAWFVALAVLGLSCLQPRRTRRAVLLGASALLGAGALLATASPVRWVAPENTRAISTCAGSVCVWRDHARAKPQVMRIVDSLTVDQRNGLPIPSRWSESTRPEPGAATFYLGSSRASDGDVAAAVAQGYLAWLSCDEALDARDAIAREQWLGARLASPAGERLAHVAEIEKWPWARQWAWFAEILPADCRPR